MGPDDPFLVCLKLGGCATLSGSVLSRGHVCTGLGTGPGAALISLQAPPLEALGFEEGGEEAFVYCKADRASPGAVTSV